MPEASGSVQRGSRLRECRHLITPCFAPPRPHPPSRPIHSHDRFKPANICRARNTTSLPKPASGPIGGQQPPGKNFVPDLQDQGGGAMGAATPAADASPWNMQARTSALAAASVCVWVSTPASHWLTAAKLWHVPVEVDVWLGHHVMARVLEDESTLYRHGMGRIVRKLELGAPIPAPDKKSRPSRRRGSRSEACCCCDRRSGSAS
jgi:hypothetical protein